MRSLLSGLLAVSIAVAGCSKPASTRAVEPQAMSAPAAAAEPSPKGGQAEGVAPVGVTQPQLAYSYQAEVQVRAEGIPDLLARHEAVCLRAGQDQCQVVGAERTSGREGAHAELKLRARPAWLQTFREGLANDVRPFGGKVIGTSTTTEDLTHDIVDTDAALKAKMVLADRLQTLLANRDGKLADLLEVEKALAQTQGEIDAARSELAVMRGRVATSDLTLSYSSRPAFTGAWTPVGDAAQGVVGVFAQALALMITLAAALAPFAIVAAAAAFLWRGLRRRRRGVSARRPE